MPDADPIETVAEEICAMAHHQDGMTYTGGHCDGCLTVAKYAAHALRDTEPMRDPYLGRHIERAQQLIAKYDDGAWDEVPMADLVGELRRLIDASYLRDARAYDALLQIPWHTSRWVTVRVIGTHGASVYGVVGDHEFSLEGGPDMERLIAWGDALRHRQAREPLPEPPLQR